MHFGLESRRRRCVVGFCGLALSSQLYCPRDGHHVEVLHEASNAKSREFSEGELIWMCVRDAEELQKRLERIWPRKPESGQAALGQCGAEQARHRCSRILAS